MRTWRRVEKADCGGFVENAAAVGIVGGITSVHPAARISLKILRVKTAKELGEVMAAGGLAQNLAALWALAAAGIYRGHKSLHATKTLALLGGHGGRIGQRAPATGK